MGFFPINHKFLTGELLVSPRILELDFDYQPFLRRHLRGDWGDLCPDDVKANETALLEHEAILSQYDAIIEGAKETVVIMTEWDRSETVVFILGEPAAGGDAPSS